MVRFIFFKPVWYHKFTSLQISSAAQNKVLQVLWWSSCEQARPLAEDWTAFGCHARRRRLWSIFEARLKYTQAACLPSFNSSSAAVGFALKHIERGVFSLPHLLRGKKGNPFGFIFTTPGLHLLYTIPESDIFSL